MTDKQIQGQKIRTLNTLHHIRKNNLYHIREQLSHLQVRQQKALGEIEEMRHNLMNEKNFLTKHPMSLEATATWSSYQKKIEDNIEQKKKICTELQIHIDKMHQALMDEYHQAKIHETTLQEKKEFLKIMIEKEEEASLQELVTIKYVRQKL